MRLRLTLVYFLAVHPLLLGWRRRSLVVSENRCGPGSSSQPAARKSYRCLCQGKANGKSAGIFTRSSATYSPPSTAPRFNWPTADTGGSRLVSEKLGQRSRSRLLESCRPSFSPPRTLENNGLGTGSTSPRYGDSDGYLGDTAPTLGVGLSGLGSSMPLIVTCPSTSFRSNSLAGDLLPDPSQGQRAALGFHRNSLKNTEAGADRELDRTKRVVDRVATTGTAWLGLTLACAECHDHKHDPISQREFYELYAFFNNLKDTDISYRIEEEWDAYEDKLAKWESDTSQLESDLSKLPKPKTPSPENDSGWESIIPDKVEAAGTDLAIQDDGSILASGKVSFHSELLCRIAGGQRKKRSRHSGSTCRGNLAKVARKENRSGEHRPAA